MSSFGCDVDGNLFGRLSLSTPLTDRVSVVHRMLLLPTVHWRTMSTITCSHVFSTHSATPPSLFHTLHETHITNCTAISIKTKLIPLSCGNASRGLAVTTFSFLMEHQREVVCWLVIVGGMPVSLSE